MNKAELIEEISNRSGVVKKDCEKILNAFMDTAKDTLAGGDKIQLVGFGTFEVAKRNARTGINPQTGKSIKIPATNVPKFKPGSAFKECVNSKKKAKKK